MLTLVNGNAALSHSPKHLSSPAQTRVKVTLATVSRAWQTLTPEQRQGWNALGQVWSPGKKSTSHGFAVFQALNNVRLQTTGTTAILADAPQKPDLLTELPPFTVTGGYNASGQFSLAVASGTYAGLVRAAATPPLSPGVTAFRPDQFRSIGTLSGLTPVVSLTDAYTARFPAPVAGMQIAVMLTPVTANGFQGQPLWLPVTVTAAPHADEPTLTLKR